MKRKELSILVVTLALIAGAAGFLQRLQRVQRLGRPGVKLAQESVTNSTGRVLYTNSVALPKHTPAYSSQQLAVDDTEFNTLPKDTTFGRRGYRSADGFECRLSVVLMGSDRTSIHKPQFCLVGQGWKIEKSEVETVRMLQPHPYDLKLMKLTVSITHKQGERLIPVRGIYAYWFVADGELTHDHWERMALIARDMLTSNVLQRWAYISYFGYGLEGQEKEVFERMKKLMIATVPDFQLASGPIAKIGYAQPQKLEDSLPPGVRSFLAAGKQP